jgi:hypothetical protein
LLLENRYLLVDLSNLELLSPLVHLGLLEHLWVQLILELRFLPENLVHLYPLEVLGHLEHRPLLGHLVLLVLL